MAKIVFAALAIAVLAPSAAQGAVIVPAMPTTDQFSLTDLQEGVNNVLSSVDDIEQAEPGAIAAITGGPSLAGAGIHLPRELSVIRSRSAYDGLDAAAITDPIPEPATWLMMILGFFGLSFAVRRRGTVSGSRVRFS